MVDLLKKGKIEQRYYVICNSCGAEAKITGKSIYDRIKSAEELGWQNNRDWYCPKCQSGNQTKEKTHEPN